MLVLGLIACVVAVVTYLVPTHLSSHDARSATRTVANRPAKSGSANRTVHAEGTPTAAQFAVLLVTASNVHGEQHNQAQRLQNADCVQASRGHYMCSYAVVRPRKAAECHLIQAEWTPNAASDFTVTLSGRVSRCATLKAALASLK
jgi:hypothetical protein